MGRLIKFFILVPLLTLIWGAANTIGATQAFTEMAGLPSVPNWQIPGLANLLEVNNAVEDAKQQARKEAQRQAVKALRKEVSKRYGPDAAALVPNDLTAAEATRILKQVLDGADLDDFKGALDEAEQNDSTGDGGTADGGAAAASNGKVPFMNPKAYKKALKVLPTLEVKGKAPMTGYSRDQFGSEWSDAAGDFAWTRNGCDTRNDVLARDLVDDVFKPGTNDCKVIRGVLPYDPYTGQKNRVFDSEDGEYATDLDAEHTVALGNAWVTGAYAWDEATRAAFANDPLVLQMVDPSANRAKGDADFATWLPANKEYRCAYAARQIQIKKTYGLWVAPAEEAALESVLTGCVK